MEWYVSESVQGKQYADGMNQTIERELGRFSWREKIQNKKIHSETDHIAPNNKQCDMAERWVVELLFSGSCV